MSDQFFWYVTRSAALVAWLAAAMSILIGLMTSSRLLGRRPTIPWLVDFHRMLGATASIFLGVHMLSLGLDSYVRFGPADLLVPWVATVPGLTRSSMAWGVIAAWLFAAVELTSLVKDRIDESVWHTIHLLSFGILGLGTLHAIQTGSDIGNPIVSGLGVSMLTAIALAGAVRLRRPKIRPEPESASDEPQQATNGDAAATRPTVGANGHQGPGPGSARPSPDETRPGAPRPRRARPAHD